MKTPRFLICSLCKGAGTNATDGDPVQPYNPCENCVGTGRKWLYRHSLRVLGVVLIGNFIFWEWGLDGIRRIFS